MWMSCKWKTICTNWIWNLTVSGISDMQITGVWVPDNIVMIEDDDVGEITATAWLNGKNVYRICTEVGYARVIRDDLWEFHSHRDDENQRRQGLTTLNMSQRRRRSMSLKSPNRRRTMLWTSHDAVFHNQLEWVLKVGDSAQWKKERRGKKGTFTLPHFAIIM